MRARLRTLCARLYSTCASATFALALIISAKLRHVVLTCLKSEYTSQSMYLNVRYTHTGTFGLKVGEVNPNMQSIHMIVPCLHAVRTFAYVHV